METLTPLSFSGFRERLAHASGFQSGQFRELEFLLGYKRPELLRFHPAGTPAYERMSRRLDEPSINDAFARFVADADGSREPERGVPGRAGPAVQDATGPGDPVRTARRLRRGLAGVALPACEARGTHHRRQSEGTGGSLGVEFLKKSLFKPLFPDLWAIRSRL